METDVMEKGVGGGLDPEKQNGRQQDGRSLRMNDRDRGLAYFHQKK